MAARRMSGESFLIPQVDRPPAIPRKPVPQYGNLGTHKGPLSSHPLPLRSLASDSSLDETTFTELETLDLTDPPPLQTRRQTLFKVIGLWKWELLSLSVSLAAFLAIVAVLRAFENKDLLSWRIPLTINAVVAVLSAIFKGSLALPVSEGLSQLKWLWFSKNPHSLADMDTYDKASRSAWGSFLLIAKQFDRPRLSPLASFGALLVLITLAVDPFSQAAVSVDSCTRAMSTPASIPRATEYATYGGHTGAGQGELDAPMQAAIFAGLYLPPANSSVSVSADVTCPTGNCTFPVIEGASFATLEMCHACRDVSRFVSKTNGSSASDNDTEVPTFDTYQLSGYGDELTVNKGRPGLVPFNISAQNAVPNPRADQLFPDGAFNESSLVSFNGIALVSEDSSCSDVSCDAEPFAFTCGIAPCVKTMTAGVTNGIYQEHEATLQPMPPGSMYLTFQLAVNRTLFNGTWTDCKGETQRSGNHSVQFANRASTSVNQTTEGSGLWYPAECIYTVQSGPVMAIGQFFDQLFEHAVLQMYGPVVQGDAWLKNLWNRGSLNMSTVDRFMEGIAISMGAQMRRASYWNESLAVPKDPWTRAQGQALQVRPCIQVRWRFLAFPAIILVAELLFFATVVAASYRSRWVADWKSSTLPLLLNGMGSDDSEAQSPHYDNEAALHAAAKRVSASFSPVDGRWRLSAKLSD